MSARLALALAVLAAATFAACGGGEAPPVVAVSITAAPSSGIDLEAATWAPEGAAVTVERRSRSRLDLLVAAGNAPASLSIRAPGACAASVSLEGARPGERRAAALAPWIDLGDDRPQLGYGEAFEVAVKPGCREAVAGRITWRQVGGAPLEELAVEQNGFRLRARTQRFAEAHAAPRPWGIVPLSPATRGAAALEATWTGVGPAVSRTLRVAAAARASGLPSLAIGQRVLLGGEGWRVAERPASARAEVVVAGGLPGFMPDVAGRWRLEDAGGASLSLRTGRHDETPLDCGRAECHASATTSAAPSPMTRVLARGLEGELGAGYDPGCAIECHAVGEPGLPDGGFAHVARELGAPLPPPAPGGWDSLPRTLRRLGGVGCTACHGPGAIPEASARRTILRSDVCAVCHDAPPRYGHVAAWRSSRMARSDAAPETRTGACASCHTTAGFLAAIGVRPAAPAGDPSAEEATGIACAACHAAHGEAIERGLVRRIEPPEELAGTEDLGPSAVCVRCHAPLRGERRPSASAASLWLGRSPRSERRSPSAHAAVPGGCLGCHSGGSGVEAPRGAGHAFAVDRARCRPCHAATPEELPGPEGRSVAARARDLRARLVARGLIEDTHPGAPHASVALAPAGASPREELAVHDVLMVLEDPAAGVHNAAYARALLDEAESALGPP